MSRPKFGWLKAEEDDRLVDIHEQKVLEIQTAEKRLGNAFRLRYDEPQEYQNAKSTLKSRRVVLDAVRAELEERLVEW